MDAPVYFQEGRGVTFFLLGLLYLILAISLDMAGWVSGMGMLVPVVLGALLLGTMMAYSRFDGFFMLSHSLATGLTWVFYLMTHIVADERRVGVFIEHGVPPLQARAYFLLERWLEWVQAALNNNASNDNYIFILEISFLVWWLAYLGTWTVFRHGYVWRGVMMAAVALLVNTYYAPKPVTGFLVTFCIVALLLLVWTNLIANRQRWRIFRIAFSQDIGFDFMRTGAIYTLAIISFAFVAPSLGRNTWFHGLLAPVNQRWEETSQEFNRLYEGLNRQERLVASGFGRTLSLGGARNVSDRAVFQVQTSKGRYWRAVTFDEFTGRQWLNNAPLEVDIESDTEIPYIPWNQRQALTQTITLFASTGGVVLAAPDVVRSSVPVVGTFMPVLGAEGETEADGEIQDELTYIRARVALGVGDSYTVVSNLTDITERALREATMEYPLPITTHYLQLPTNFSPRIAALAREVAGNEDAPVYDRAKRVERFLRGYTYDEEIEAPTREQDPVEYFLFEIQRGYCDYYASAMAVMLRSLGIPARTVSGYAEGLYDEESGIYVITERDAHTWVEVYFPGYGWVEFEPTAGESLLERPSGADLPENRNIPGAPDDFMEREDRFNDPDYDPLSDPFSDPYMENLQQFDGPLQEFQDGVAGLRTWIVGSVLLTLAALVGGWWLLRRRAWQGPDGFVPQKHLLVYARLLEWAQRLGVAAQIGLTPYERSAILVRELPVGAPFIQRITDMYVEFRFAPPHSYRADREAASDQELENNWRQLRPILLRAWLERRLRRGHQEQTARG